MTIHLQLVDTLIYMRPNELLSSYIKKCIYMFDQALEVEPLLIENMKLFLWNIYEHVDDSTVLVFVIIISYEAVLKFVFFNKSL